MPTFQARILIVEDEDAIANGLRFNFEAEGYEVILKSDGPSALSYLDAHPQNVDIAILDLMLPGMSGYEICREIRDRDVRMPIIILSARTLSEDKTHAFNCGTDQYITKPFALPELLSRVQNLLKRRRQIEQVFQSSQRDNYSFGNVHVNFRTFEVQRENDRHSLTTMELQLLRYFIEHEGEVLSRSKILSDVWEQGADVTSRTIDNFVLRLRKYIEEDPGNPRYLLSVRGTGYRFVTGN